MVVLRMGPARSIDGAPRSLAPLPARELRGLFFVYGLYSVDVKNLRRELI